MVILYSTHCPMCMLVERQLQGKNIKYEKCDDIEKIKELGFSHVPILEIGGKLYTTTKEILDAIKTL